MPDDIYYANNNEAQEVVTIDPVSGNANWEGGGTKTTAIPSANILTVVKNSAGRLGRIVVTATGAGGPVNIYDNATAASGTIIGVVPANAAVGTIYDLRMPALNGITVGVGPATSPAFTIAYN